MHGGCCYCLAWVIKAAVGAVEIIEEGPSYLANFFGFRVPFKRFEEPPNVTVRNVEQPMHFKPQFE